MPYVKYLEYNEKQKQFHVFYPEDEYRLNPRLDNEPDEDWIVILKNIEHEECSLFFNFIDIIYPDSSQLPTTKTMKRLVEAFKLTQHGEQVMNLKEARKQSGLTQKQLSEKAGVSMVAISLLENGHTIAHVTTQKKLEDALGQRIT